MVKEMSNKTTILINLFVFFWPTFRLVVSALRVRYKTHRASTVCSLPEITQTCMTRPVNHRYMTIRLCKTSYFFSKIMKKGVTALHAFEVLRRSVRTNLKSLSDIQNDIQKVISLTLDIWNILYFWHTNILLGKFWYPKGS